MGVGGYDFHCKIDKKGTAQTFNNDAPFFEDYRSIWWFLRLAKYVHK